MKLQRPETMAVEQALCSLINDALRRQRLTQMDAARIMRIPQPTISQTLNGNGRRWTIGFLLAISRAIDVSPTELLGKAIDRARALRSGVSIETLMALDELDRQKHSLEHQLQELNLDIRSLKTEL